MASRSSTGKKRAFRMAWIGLPLLPICFLLFLDWQRVRERFDALWSSQARSPVAAVSVQVPPVGPDPEVREDEQLPPPENSPTPAPLAFEAPGLPVVKLKDTAAP